LFLVIKNYSQKVEALASPAAAASGGAAAV
jgi:hypothetical protein